jgi:restriction endonuclease
MPLWGCLFLVDEDGLKPLSCLFLDDVLCSYRKDERLTVLSRCFKCPHYERWQRMMDEDDERMMDEIDEMRKRLDRHSAGGLE